jgi:hypothetical protein
MLRSALSCEAGAPKNLKEWTRHLSAGDRSASAAAIRAAWNGGLSRQGMAVLNEHADDCTLTPQQVLAVLKNHLELCEPDERKYIEAWTHRWQEEMKKRRNV